jgi:flagellar motor switch protein FliN/FliY
MEDNKEEIYDIVFNQLEPQERKSVNAMSSILKADLSIVVSIGQASQSIESILELKEDSVIVLDKLIDEQLDVYINDKKVAYGESVIIDDKIAVRLTKVQEADDN